MRVLLVNDAPPGPTGGAEVYLATIAEALEQAGEHVEVLAGEVLHEGWRKALDLWDPAAARLVAEAARAFGADVVHHHNVVRELSVSVLTATPHLPVVLTLHDHRLLGRGDVPDVGVRGRVQRHLKRPLDRSVARRRVDVVVGVSEVLADRARAAGFARVVAVPQPVHAPTRPTTPAGGGSGVLFVGRLTEEKGVPELLEAVRELARQRPDVPVTFVGDGPLRGAVDDVAASCPDVDVRGHLTHDEVSEHLHRARVLVVPSRPSREGGSLVAIEAARHARPVVVGADPAVRAVAVPLGHAAVTDGTPRGLLAELLRLVDHPDLATRRGATGAANARRHDPHAVAEHLRAVHADAVRRHANRHASGERSRRLRRRG